MNIIPIVAVSLVAVTAIGFFVSTQKTQNSSNQQKSSMKISGQEAQKVVEDGAFLLDVRTQQEFNERHIDGATQIAVGELAERMDELPKDRLIIVYCRSGRRAARAVQMLLQEGFEAKNLGGLTDWPEP